MCIRDRSKEVDDWIAQEESDFTAWFNKMKADLQQEQTVLDPVSYTHLI